jgi:hypothetical protein
MLFEKMLGNSGAGHIAGQTPAAMVRGVRSDRMRSGR